MRSLNKRIFTIAFTIILIFALSGVVSAKKAVEYPFGFTHGMSQEEALGNLDEIGANVTRTSSSTILADYSHIFDGINVQTIYLRFFDGKLNRVALDSDGVNTSDEHLLRLQSVSDHLKSEYKVFRISNNIPVNDETDLKKRYLCRYQDSTFEILIYSYYENGQYFMSLNFVKIFAH